MKRMVQALSSAKGVVFLSVVAAVLACPAGNANADVPKNGLDPETLSAHGGLVDVPKNGLRSEALSAQGGLVDVPKNGAAPGSIPATWPVLSPLIRGSLQAGAQEVMQYIVSCALDPSDQVTAKAGGADSTTTWQGEIGLCKKPPFGDWASGPPSKACLEMVYACLLARTNPRRLSVPVSLRGPNSALVPRSEIPLQTHYRENGGTPIASFERCADPAAAAREGTARNCGWSRRYAGRCVANQEVRLAIGSEAETPAGTSSQSEVMVRVCDGIYGCDDPAGTRSTAGGQRRYSRMDKTVRLGAQEVLTFTCPENGPPIEGGSSGHPVRYGYFGAMLALQDPKEPVPAGIDVRPVTRDTAYPASEYQVFTVREGAFYGSFPGAPGSRAGDQYACYSDGWDSRKAEGTGRHCAGERSSCFANAPKPCLTKDEHGSEPGACRGETAPEPGGYYLSCEGTTGSERFRYPITVYVNASGR